MAVIIVWFEVSGPGVTTDVKPFARASASTYSSLRVLLPPSATPEQSSRFIQRSTPRRVLRRSSGTSGVGNVPSGIRGTPARNAVS